ncbi:MAG: hypothetical protein O3A10_16065 [Chloroflexi bacterium]|nr:hypothetical protein [Chloroflexota bacterium]MDA1148066.1 hypothetical protein [Chloroflexota bacterium]
MPMPRVFKPQRPPRVRRLRRAAVGSAAAALLLFGAACATTSDAATRTGQDGGPAADTVAALAGSEPGVSSQGIVEGAVSAAPAVEVAAPLPDWVARRLEAGPPTLALTSPAPGAVFSESYVVFSGQAAPGSVVAAGPFQDKADASGYWSIGLVLTAGQNIATFTTTSEEGEVTKESVTVHFKPTSQDKHGYVKDGEHKDGDYADKKDHVAPGFQAWEKYGSCGDDLPYDYYKGTAAPGAVITVSSPYGSGTGIAGDDGYWKIKVTFEAAPVGEPFTVTVSDGTDVKTFTFTRK